MARPRRSGWTVLHEILSGGALVAFTLAGCSSGGAPAPPCVANLTPTCAATYAPATFDTIFTNILQPNCAVGTGTCHTSDFAAGKVVFADANDSYATLLGKGGVAPLVLPSDPGCSTLMKRLESSDPSYHMPRGPTFLSAGDRCTIVQWIAEGSTR